jgi:hypothetical protein
VQLDCRRLFIRIHAFDRDSSTLTIPLVSRRGRRRATVSLLTRVTGRTTRRRRVATRTALRPRRTTWRRLVLLVGATGWGLVLLLTWVATLLLAVLARGWTVSGALLVLSVVAGVDSTKDELEDPKIRGEVDGWVGTSHLGRLVLVVGCAVHHSSDNRVVVELAQELGG